MQGKGIKFNNFRFRHFRISIIIASVVITSCCYKCTVVAIHYAPASSSIVIAAIATASITPIARC